MDVSSVIADVSTVLNSVVTTIAGNPVLVVMLGMSLVGAGARLFKKLRKSTVGG